MTENTMPEMAPEAVQETIETVAERLPVSLRRGGRQTECGVRKSSKKACLRSSTVSLRPASFSSFLTRQSR